MYPNSVDIVWRYARSCYKYSNCTTVVNVRQAVVCAGITNYAQFCVSLIVHLTKSSFVTNYFRNWRLRKASHYTKCMSAQMVCYTCRCKRWLFTTSGKNKKRLPFQGSCNKCLGDMSKWCWSASSTRQIQIRGG